MGFGGNSGGSQYLNVNKGTLKYKTKDGETVVGGWYDGRIVKIERRQDTYEGNTLEKVLLYMEDADSPDMPRATIQFLLESWFAVTFFARLGQVIDNPRVRVGVYGSETNDKISFAYVQTFNADGTRNKIQADPSFPKPEKIKAGTKEVSDYSKVIAAAEALVAKVNAKANPDPQGPPADPSGPAAGNAHDDLPF